MLRFRDLPIRTKLYGGFAVILFCFAVIGFLSYININQLVSGNQKKIQIYKVIVSLQQMTSLLNDAERGQHGYIITGKESFLMPYNMAIKKIDGVFAQIKNLTSNDVKQQASLKKLEPLIHTKLEHMRNNISLRRNKGLQTVAPIVAAGRGKDIMDDIRAIIDEMFAEENALFAERSIVVSRSTAFTRVVIVAGSCMVILLGFLIASFFVRSIVRPIHEIMRRIIDIETNGNLTAEIFISSNDEIGDMGKAFNRLLIGLKNIIVGVINVAEQINQMAENFSVSTKQMSVLMQDFSATSQQISKGTQDIASRVETVAETMTKIGVGVEQTARNTQGAAQSAELTKNATKDGNSAVIEVIDKMVDIDNKVHASAEAINQLGQRSEQIYEIVHVITDIADQTNLLALNAAIEAARAGEAGRGFAVVADEVKKLAEGSGRAAKQIGELIKSILKETRQAVENMESGTSAVAEGKVVVEKAGTALQNILKIAGSSSMMVEQISVATQQMAEGTRQVTHNINDIAVTAEGSAAATEEAASTTEQIMASIQDVAAAAQQLAEESVNMKRLIGKFNVGEGFAESKK